MDNLSSNLSRRERQIMDVVYEKGKASAVDIQEGIPSPPSYSAVRALLAVLVEKGFLKHERQGRRYVYQPTISPDRARKAALRTLMKTFFEGSPEKMVASLLDPSEKNLSPTEIDRIHSMIEEKEAEEGGK